MKSNEMQRKSNYCIKFTAKSKKNYNVVLSFSLFFTKIPQWQAKVENNNV